MAVRLSEIEQVVFSPFSCLFFFPLQYIITLENDLIEETRSAGLQVKTLSPGKARNEGHMVDVLADTLFNLVLVV